MTDRKAMVLQLARLYLGERLAGAREAGTIEEDVCERCVADLAGQIDDVGVGFVEADLEDWLSGRCG